MITGRADGPEGSDERHEGRVPLALVGVGAQVLLEAHLECELVDG